jgi:methylenetetrahydrofolate dehydrogenase (NADP+)/methenyltetrahydrofolate cyclohydrolase
MILLKGKELSDKLYDLFDLKKETAKLVVFTVGDDPASKVYVRNKQRACERVGIKFENVILKENTSSEEFSDIIMNKLSEDVFKLDYDDFVKYGMILQLPAPKHLVDIFNTMVPTHFDVDGFGEINFRSVMTTGTATHLPATPKGIMTLLRNYKIPIEGKHVVIVGRSNIVGKPLAQMMLKENATVTICHSKTENLERITKTADILVVATGKPKFINETHISEGVTIIDVGINKTENGICGDVDFDRVKDKCYAITPVPGGVGPMTVYSLIENLINQ